jgi:hypothetical protein
MGHFISWCSSLINCIPVYVVTWIVIEIALVLEPRTKQLLLTNDLHGVCPIVNGLKWPTILVDSSSNR